MQATVANFSPETRSGTVLFDDGVEMPFDTAVFDASGLRLLRLGQRVNIHVAGGHVVALTLATFPLPDA